MTRPGYRYVSVLVSLCLLFFSVPTLARNADPLVTSPVQVNPPAESPTLPALTFNPLIAAMLAQVQQQTVYDYDASLAGDRQVVVGGLPYTITTRNTDSGTPIDKATYYAYERMQADGLNISFHYWTQCGRTNRNVVGTLHGVTRPNEIVLITAHIDDMPSSGLAPGADDNASGTTGVLVAAEIMSRFKFERTIRFVLFTGEEQGLCGSAAYAADAHAQGDDIRAVVNLDMIAYDAVGLPILDLHARSYITGSVELAQTFSQTVGTYGLNLIPDIFINYSLGNYSDNKSFWDQGYNAILAIEDDDDFTPYYHTSNDRPSTLNQVYFTNMVKAAIGTVAHMAYPIYNPPDVTPATAGQSGAPGSLVTYTLQVSNTNSITDTFTVAVGGNAWPVTPITPVAPVPPHTGAPVTVVVSVPSSAPRGTTDAVTATVALVSDPTKSDAALLTTTSFYTITPPDVSASAMQWGQPGWVMTYTLQVTNTSVGVDSFDVSVSGNAWPVTVTTPVGPMSSQATMPLTVTVTIPPDAPGGASDVVTVTVASQVEPVKLDAVMLTTMTFYRVYLPFLSKDG